MIVDFKEWFLITFGSLDMFENQITIIYDAIESFLAQQLGMEHAWQRKIILKE